MLSDYNEKSYKIIDFIKTFFERFSNKNLTVPKILNNYLKFVIYLFFLLILATLLKVVYKSSKKYLVSLRKDNFVIVLESCNMKLISE